MSEETLRTLSMEQTRAKRAFHRRIRKWTRKNSIVTTLNLSPADRYIQYRLSKQGDENEIL